EKGTPEYDEVTMQVARAIEARMAEETTDEWVARLDAVGVPAGAVRQITEMADDPQVLANDLAVELEHPVTGSVTMVGPVVRMHETPTAAQSPPPTLGQHSREILAELGYAPSDVDELARRGVIV